MRVVTAVLLVLLAGCMVGERQRMERILVQHQERYRVMDVQDLYKLIHQAAMGSWHADRHRMSAKMLRHEFATLRGDAQAPLCEKISPSGNWVRVHLRPYAYAGEDPDALVEAFEATVQSAEQASVARLQLYWGWAEALAASGALRFTADQLRTYFAAREAEGFPAVDHSARYRNIYRPSYAVIHRRHAPMRCP